MSVEETSTAQEVRNLVEENVFCSDYDKVLLVEWWKLNGLRLTKRQKSVFFSLSSPQTVLRARRSLLGEYPRSGRQSNFIYAPRPNWLVRLWRKVW